MKEVIESHRNYVWKIFGESGDLQDADLAANAQEKKIAIIATSSGFKPSEIADKMVYGRLNALKRLGFQAYAVQFEYVGEDGIKKNNLVFETSSEPTTGYVGGAVDAVFIDRGIGAKNGIKQIIECAENGVDIFPFMGGVGFVDKIGAVIEHFNNPDVKKPDRPIRIFNFSDCSFAAILQSHHPDIFRFYSTTSLRDLVSSKVPSDAVDREKYNEIENRNLTDLTDLLIRDEIKQYPRKTLYFPDGRAEIVAENVQYFPLHSDMILADAIDFDVERGGRGNLESGIGRFGHMVLHAQKLNSSRPYILGFEAFLQQSTSKKEYDNNFADYLDEFLSQRAAINQLPVAVEMGLFETRIDGHNGYADKAFRMHDEETGLIDISDFNIKRIFAHREKISQQISEIIKAKDSQEGLRVNREIEVTEIPQAVKIKVTLGNQLEEGDIKAILELENKKILERQREIGDVCEKYRVPLIMNNRHGHNLNLGVVGGGLVNVKINEQGAELEQLPTAHRISPLNIPTSPSLIGDQKDRAKESSFAKLTR